MKLPDFMQELQTDFAELTGRCPPRCPPYKAIVPSKLDFLPLAFLSFGGLGYSVPDLGLYPYIVFNDDRNYPNTLYIDILVI